MATALSHGKRRTSYRWRAGPGGTSGPVSTSAGRLSRVHRVLEQLYEQPIVSVKDVRALIATTFAGANQIVQRLVDLKILVEITGQARHRRLRYDAYVRLFDEEAGA
jgi:hypothetical protein